MVAGMARASIHASGQLRAESKSTRQLGGRRGRASSPSERRRLTPYTLRAEGGFVPNALRMQQPPSSTSQHMHIHIHSHSCGGAPMPSDGAAPPFAAFRPPAAWSVSDLLLLSGEATEPTEPDPMDTSPTPDTGAAMAAMAAGGAAGAIAGCAVSVTLAGCGGGAAAAATVGWWGMLMLCMGTGGASMPI